ncbi:MAG: hypothetical protein J5879_06660, partial [Clostridia bacterium]|nr:hypothetical protein [Clostridia bacterium]
NNGEEYRRLPEYTPTYPDISFFRESSVTMHEENIFTANTPPEEKSRRQEHKEKENEKKKKEAALRLLIRSAVKAAAVFAAAFALVMIISNYGGYGTANGAAIAAALNTAKRPAFNETQDHSNAEFLALWNGDPDGPHKYDYSKPVNTVLSDCLQHGRADYVCEECGAVKTVNDATGPHSPAAAVVENKVPAGCAADGSHDEVVYCALCHSEISREKIVDRATGDHTPSEPVTVSRSEATCTEAGEYVECVYCLECGAELDRRTVAIPATGHTAGDQDLKFIRQPTCTGEGMYSLTTYCKTCGAHMYSKIGYSPATGHYVGAAVEENRVEATCTAPGSYDEVRYCTVCGAEVRRQTVAIPATGHTAGPEREENRKEATCTAAGSYDKVTRCTVCGEVLSQTANVKIPAKGHNWAEDPWKAVGTTVPHCADCGEAAIKLYYDSTTDYIRYVINESYYNKYFDPGTVIGSETSLYTTGGRRILNEEYTGLEDSYDGYDLYPFHNYDVYVEIMFMDSETDKFVSVRSEPIHIP